MTSAWPMIRLPQLGDDLLPADFHLVGERDVVGGLEIHGVGELHGVPLVG